MPRPTRYLCAVVAELSDLRPGMRATVDQVADRSGVNREAARWCLNRLQESLLADAEDAPARGALHGPLPRGWALTATGRQQASGLLERGRHLMRRPARMRGTPALTDANLDVGRALLAAGGELTVAELARRSGRCDRTVRRVLHEMQDREWVSRSVSSRWQVRAGTPLWWFTEAGFRQAQDTYRDGRQVR
ncbi:hypothetical protein NUM_73040 [Actinocatenispora comari]|uniref:Uncharacterized protein n=1 Tax=Actinocatenispora comari TaxID=2807577 RepID=A0A8J4EQ48_9ACTN|nr:hypothetical protein NUM_73040 [Actinocatenispora comari]